MTKILNETQIEHLSIACENENLEIIKDLIQDLSALNLSGKKIKDKGAKALAEALKGNSTLTSLNLDYNQIGIEGTQALAETLKINKSLTSLVLSGNQIKNEGATILAETLKAGNALTYLDLDGNQIGYTGTKSLAEAIKVNRALTDLVLSGNQIGDAGAKALAKAIKNNKTLTYLDLDGSQIEDEGAKALAEAVKGNSTLTSLVLSDNQIRDEGTKALAKAIQDNKSLTYLYLDGNQIKDEGAKALAKTIKDNKSLTYLYLDGNQIGNKGTNALAEALKVNKTLTDLNLNYNPIENEGAKALAEALKVNETLSALYLYGNQIGNKGTSALAEALKVNNTLTDLNLSNNEISYEGAKTLAEALEKNSTLTDLNLRKNQLTPDGIEALMYGIKNTNSLITISIEGEFEAKITEIEEALSNSLAILRIYNASKGTTNKVKVLNNRNEQIRQELDEVAEHFFYQPHLAPPETPEIDKLLRASEYYLYHKISTKIVPSIFLTTFKKGPSTLQSLDFASFNGQITEYFVNKTFEKPAKIIEDLGKQLPKMQELFPKLDSSQQKNLLLKKFDAFEKIAKNILLSFQELYGTHAEKNSVAHKAYYEMHNRLSKELNILAEKFIDFCPEDMKEISDKFRDQINEFNNSFEQELSETHLNKHQLNEKPPSGDEKLENHSLSKKKKKTTKQKKKQKNKEIETDSTSTSKEKESEEEDSTISLPTREQERKSAVDKKLKKGKNKVEKNSLDSLDLQNSGTLEQEIIVSETGGYESDSDNFSFMSFDSTMSSVSVFSTMSAESSYSPEKKTLFQKASTKIRKFFPEFDLKGEKKLKKQISNLEGTTNPGSENLPKELAGDFLSNMLRKNKEKIKTKYAHEGEIFPAWQVDNKEYYFHSKAANVIKIDRKKLGHEYYCFIEEDAFKGKNSKDEYEKIIKIIQEKGEVSKKENSIGVKIMKSGYEIKTNSAMRLFTNNYYIDEKTGVRLIIFRDVTKQHIENDKKISSSTRQKHVSTHDDRFNIPDIKSIAAEEKKDSYYSLNFQNYDDYETEQNIAGDYYTQGSSANE